MEGGGARSFGTRGQIDGGGVSEVDGVREGGGKEGGREGGKEGGLLKFWERAGIL